MHEGEIETPLRPSSSTFTTTGCVPHRPIHASRPTHRAPQLRNAIHRRLQQLLLSLERHHEQRATAGWYTPPKAHGRTMHTASFASTSATRRARTSNPPTPAPFTTTIFVPCPARGTRCSPRARRWRWRPRAIKSMSRCTLDALLPKMKLLLIVALVQRRVGHGHRCKLNLRTHTRRGRARVRRRLGGRVHTHRAEQVVRRLPRDDALVRTFMNTTVSASLATTRCAGAEVRARHRRDDVRSLRAGEQAQARGRLDGDGRALAEGYRDDTHHLIHEDVKRRGGSAGWPAKDALTVSHSNAVLAHRAWKLPHTHHAPYRSLATIQQPIHAVRTAEEARTTKGNKSKNEERKRGMEWRGAT
ncbi:hypothetical protein DFH09DRAFT_1321817 [Mycena vulgaris]|nr:hypothetical protein DFH09DRAFT_1321817 [Mycena vulgaris]